MQKQKAGDKSNIHKTLYHSVYGVSTLHVYAFVFSLLWVCCHEWTASAGSIGIVFSSSHLYDKYSLCILWSVKWRLYLFIF